jgi:hypothetical protein
VVKVAARYRYRGIMSLLLDRRGAKVKIIEKVVKAVARYRYRGIIALLLD